MREGGAVEAVAAHATYVAMPLFGALPLLIPSGLYDWLIRGSVGGFTVFLIIPALANLGTYSWALVANLLTPRRWRPWGALVAGALFWLMQLYNGIRGGDFSRGWSIALMEIWYLFCIGTSTVFIAEFFEHRSEIAAGRISTP